MARAATCPRRRWWAWTLTLATALSGAGCVAAPDPGAEDGLDDPFLDAGGKVDGLDVEEGTPEALGVLRLVNEADLATLDQVVGLQTTAASAIVDHRLGDDGELGTRDDHEILTLAALDGVPWVGPRSFQRLLDHAHAEGWVRQWALRQEAPGRVVALGDLHGDLGATREALWLAGAIDEEDRWIGGDLVVVQTGDVLDRGDEELEIMDLLDGLSREAVTTGGALLTLLGNHELMNLYGDYSYVTPAGFEVLEGQAGLDLSDPWLEDYPEDEQARAAAFLQGGPFARRLAEDSVVVIVDDTLFVHAGLLPAHVEHGLDRLNYEGRAFALWDDLPPPALLDAEDGPLWYRGFGDDGELDCALLEETLALTGASRMVIGHTVQEGGVTSACEDQLYRVDTGMSASYGGLVEVLEISAEGVFVLTLE